MAGAPAAPLGAWPKDGEGLLAKCTAQHSFANDDEFTAAHFRDKDGRIASPGPECKGSGGHGCGIYSTTELGVIDTYLSRSAPVFGLVELSGRVMECEHGYPAEYAAVAAILLIDEVLSKPVSHDLLRKVARAYGVQALVPHSTRSEDYRSLINPDEPVVTDDEIARFLKGEL